MNLEIKVNAFCNNLKRSSWSHVSYFVFSSKWSFLITCGFTSTPVKFLHWSGKRLHVHTQRLLEWRMFRTHERSCESVQCRNRYSHHFTRSILFTQRVCTCICVLSQPANILKSTQKASTPHILRLCRKISEEPLRVSLLWITQVVDRCSKTDFTRVHNKIAVVSTQSHSII